MTIVTPSGRTIEPVEVVTPEYLQAKIDASTPTDIVSHGELDMRLEALSQVDLPEGLVTEQELQHAVDLISTAVDAKFDMLRVAIAESTDYDTLKARLLAVLQ